METNSSIGSRVEDLDASLFDDVVSEATHRDRKSLLALHAACRAVHGNFRYLEIGSHLGGSLAALIADPSCEAIISIDARPIRQPDARGPIARYPDNSTARMLAALRSSIPGAQLDKLRCIDASTESLLPAAFEFRPQLCFIDAEHTDEAVLRDGRFCLSLLDGQGAVAFHDIEIVYRAVELLLAELREARRPHVGYALPDHLFVIELGEAPLATEGHVSAMRAESGYGLLACLSAGEFYRAAVTSARGRTLQRLGLLRVEIPGMGRPGPGPLARIKGLLGR